MHFRCAGAYFSSSPVILLIPVLDAVSCERLLCVSPVDTLRILMIGVDLFAGAGGMSVGARMAGVSVATAVEMDAKAAATYERNHPGVKIIKKDIRSVERIDKPEGGPLIVFGGPPCQGFSTSNQRTRSTQNYNNWLFEEYFRIIKQINPDWVVFENVKGILETENGLFLDLVLSSFEEEGFTISQFLLNAKDYGIPQNRSRFFIIASRDGCRIGLPKQKDEHFTVKDALYDLPSLEPGAKICYLPYKTKAKSRYSIKLRQKLRKSHNHLVSNNNAVVLNRYSYVKPGGNWQDIPHNLMQNYSNLSGCHTGIYHRLDPDDVSIVIGNYRKNMLIHPWEDRGLSVREAARLQSFPDSFVFTGSIGFQQQQVGNAVPPLLAKAVFEAILEQI